MPVLGFDPFREIDRMTEQLFGATPGSRRAPRFLPMDLFRTDYHYMLYADLPGVDPGSIDIQVDGDVLTIRAQRTLRDDDGAQWISSERFGGSYLRRLSLGEQVDSERIEATYVNGVLAISIPLAHKTEPRKVSVSVGNGAAVQPALTGAGSEGG